MKLKNLLTKYKNLTVYKKLIINVFILFILIKILEYSRINNLSSLHTVSLIAFTIAVVFFGVITTKILFLETKKSIKTTKDDFTKIKKIIKGEKI